MAKKKLIHFEEMKQFPNVFQPELGELFDKKNEIPLAWEMKGNWRANYFKNEKPLVLELGCGKGEYTVGLAQRYPTKSFIGVDIKGARIYTGAKQALDAQLPNVAFIRTRIDFIEACFGPQEVDEIWITFPDPQPQANRVRKRLTSPLFLDRYLKFLKPGGLLHIKTDSALFYEYSLESTANYPFEMLLHSADLYGDFLDGLNKEDQSLFEIKTFYEQKFLALGKKICYYRGRLNN